MLYLPMKNYSSAGLFQAELTLAHTENTGARARREWAPELMRTFVMPGISGKTPAQDEAEQDPPPSQFDSSGAIDEEILARQMVIRFGRGLPIEDGEHGMDIVNPITRMPCGSRFISTGKTDLRYCLGFGIDKFGILGQFPDAASSLEVLDKA